MILALFTLLMTVTDDPPAAAPELSSSVPEASPPSPMPETPVAVPEASSPAPSPALPAAPPEWQQPPWDFIVVPVLGLNVDEGIGGGVLFALHRYDGEGAVFRDDFALRVFLTSRLVQRHEIKWEGVDVFDLPLRAWVRLGFYSTVTQNFCGTGNAVHCDVDRAEAAADDAGLDDGAARDEFVRHFYLTRFIKPHGDVLLRWRLGDSAARPKFEIMGGARVADYIAGDFFESGPYPGSLYAKGFPDGESGVSAVLQLGVTVDGRDFEPSPTRGFFFEASLRASSSLWGSHWNNGGGNASLAFYVPLPLAVTLASRSLGDILVGDVPIEEQATIGGTRDHTAFGGQWLGRGLREHRGIGKIKVIQQFEVRREIFDFDVFGVQFDVGAGVFGDAGLIGADVNDFGGGVPVGAGGDREAGSPVRLLFGTGVGLRVLLNRALLMRLDLAWSPQETITPSFYTPFGYPF